MLDDVYTGTVSTFKCCIDTTGIFLIPFSGTIMSNQLIRTLSTCLLDKAHHVGVRSMTLQCPVPELLGNIGSQTTTIEKFMNGTVKPIDKQDVYLLAQTRSHTGPL